MEDGKRNPQLLVEHLFARCAAADAVRDVDAPRSPAHRALPQRSNHFVLAGIRQDALPPGYCSAIKIGMSP